MKQEQLNALLRLIEQTIGRKVKTPKDFTFLASCIFDKTGETLSTSTLKRIWGYLPGYSSIRVSTLDILARLVGYEDWDAFCLQTQQAEGGTDSEDSEGDTGNEGNEDSEDSPQAPVPSALTEPQTIPRPAMSSPRTFASAVAMVLLAAVAAVLVWVFVAGRGGDGDVLYTGETFPTYATYLSRFGITPSDNWWDEPLPHHNGIFIWGPEYGNPQWHNDGDSINLMPTITEYWTPAENGQLDNPLADTLTTERNRLRLWMALRNHELRITFMKNLVDTGYVFLGVYAVDTLASDSSRIVWKRVADELDLRRLDGLEQLR